MYLRVIIVLLKQWCGMCYRIYRLLLSSHKLMGFINGRPMGGGGDDVGFILCRGIIAENIFQLPWWRWQR